MPTEYTRDERFIDEVKSGDLRTEAHGRVYRSQALRRHLGRWPTTAEYIAAGIAYESGQPAEVVAKARELREAGFPGVDLWAGAERLPPSEVYR